MKRHITSLSQLLLIVLMTLLCSCHKEVPKYRVGVSQCSSDNWRRQTNIEMLQEVDFYDDITLEFKFAESSSELQISQIEEFINDGVDMLIVIPNHERPLTPVIERAYDLGIKIIVVDTKIESDKYTAFLGADNFNIGELVGEYISTIKDREIEVIEISGDLSSTVAKERYSGLRSSLSPYEHVNITHSVDAAWDQQSAQRAVDSLLRLHPETDIIFAHNDNMAFGAYKAVSKLGLKSSVKIVGIDGLAGENEGLDLVSKGYLDMTLLYPTFGGIIMNRAHQILHNQNFPKETKFETAIINRTNSRVELLKIRQLNVLDSRIKELNINLAESRQRSNLQQWLLIIALLVIVATAVVTVVITKMMVAIRKSNKLLQIKNIEISNQKEELVLQRESDKVEIFNPIKSADQEFMESINSYLEANLSNSDLFIDDMGQDLGYSKSQLYRKIKAITGEAPNKLLRAARLQKARRLLHTTTLSISEIAYEVGFTSPSYFTKSYKNYFGEVPSDREVMSTKSST